MQTDWVDDVALAYAKNYSELRAARLHFEAQRGAVMSALESFAKSEVERIGLSFSGKGSSKANSEDASIWSGQYWYIGLKGDYADARAASNSKVGDGNDEVSSVGCGFASRDFWGDKKEVPLGIYAYLAFTATKHEATALMKGVSVQTCCPLAESARQGAGGLYFVDPAILPGSERFTLDSAREVLTSLIGAFRDTDRLLAGRYRQRYEPSNGK